MYVYVYVYVYIYIYIYVYTYIIYIYIYIHITRSLCYIVSHYIRPCGGVRLEDHGAGPGRI